MTLPIELQFCLLRWTLGRSCSHEKIGVPNRKDCQTLSVLTEVCNTDQGVLNILQLQHIYKYIYIYNIYIYIYIYMCVCVCVCVWQFHIGAWHRYTRWTGRLSQQTSNLSHPHNSLPKGCDPCFTRYQVQGEKVVIYPATIKQLKLH